MRDPESRASLQRWRPDKSCGLELAHDPEGSLPIAREKVWVLVVGFADLELVCAPEGGLAGAQKRV